MFLQELPSANIWRSQWSHGFGEFSRLVICFYTCYTWCSICWNRTVCMLWISVNITFFFASSLSPHLKTLNQGQSFYVQLPNTGAWKRYYNQAKPLELLHLLAANCSMFFPYWEFVDDYAVASTGTSYSNKLCFETSTKAIKSADLSSLDFLNKHVLWLRYYKSWSMLMGSHVNNSDSWNYNHGDQLFKLNAIQNQENYYIDIQ